MLLWLICWGARTQKLKGSLRNTATELTGPMGDSQNDTCRARGVLGKGEDSSPQDRQPPPAPRRPRSAETACPLRRRESQLPLAPHCSRTPRAEYLRARTPVSLSPQAQSGNTAHAHRHITHAPHAPPIEMLTVLSQSLGAGCGRCLASARARTS